MRTTSDVKVRFDDEAKFWYVESSSPPGLNLEAASLDSLQAQVPLAAAELLGEANGFADFEIPLQLLPL